MIEDKTYKKYKHFSFIMTCYAIVYCFFMLPAGFFICCILYLIFGNIFDNKNEGIFLTYTTVVTGILTIVFIILEAVIPSFTKKSKKKHYEFILSKNFKQQNLEKAIMLSENYKEKIELDGIKVFTTRRKILLGIYGIEYQCYVTLNYEEFDNIKYKEDLLTIKKAVKKATKELYERYNKYDWYQINVVIFIQNWNKEVEKVLDKFWEEQYGYVNLVVKFNNKLCMRPLYLGYGDGFYSRMKRNIFDIINLIK